MKIALIHYSYPPVIGGVEAVLERHASLLARHGHEVSVICAAGQTRDSRIRLLLIPEIAASHPLTLAAQAEIQEGEAGPKFKGLSLRLKEALQESLRGCQAVCVHNLLLMPFNLAATEALRQIALEQRQTRFISWIHDLAACNPDYLLPNRAPWDLLRSKLPGFEFVAISQLRAHQFAQLTGCAPAECRVIPHGIDPEEALNLTPAVAHFLLQRQILSRKAVLLCPARLLKRKNLERALEIMAALKRLTGPGRCACLITGACDPHNPDSAAYAQHLRNRSQSLGLQDEVFFVSDFFTVTNPDLVSLYSASDAVLYPSLQEGFGIPLLEAAVHRLPVFCGDLEPLKDLALCNARFLGREASPCEIAEEINQTIKWTAESRKDVLNRYGWEAIYSQEIEPFLASRAQPLP